MVTGFDLIHNNRPLQKHWIKRIIAFFIDLFLSSIAAYIIIWLLGIRFMPSLLVNFPVFAGIIQVFYSAICEYNNRQTFGKLLLDLKVEGLKSGLSLYETIIRNFSKIHGLLVFLDMIVGLATRGDPRQRYLDRVANTTVTGSPEPKHIDRYIREHLRIHHEPRGAPPNENIEQDNIQINSCENCDGQLEPAGGALMRCMDCGRIQ